MRFRFEIEAAFIYVFFLQMLVSLLDRTHAETETKFIEFFSISNLKKYTSIWMICSTYFMKIKMMVASLRGRKKKI